MLQRNHTMSWKNGIYADFAIFGFDDFASCLMEEVKCQCYLGALVHCMGVPVLMWLTRNCVFNYRCINFCRCPNSDCVSLNWNWFPFFVSYTLIPKTFILWGRPISISLMVSFWASSPHCYCVFSVFLSFVFFCGEIKKLNYTKLNWILGGRPQAIFKTDRRRIAWSGECFNPGLYPFY